MSSAAFQIAVIVFLILLNGFFAMSETALVSSRKARLRQRAEEGDGGTRRTGTRGLSQPLPLHGADRCLGYWGLGRRLRGVTLAEPLAGTLRAVPALGPYAGPIAFGAVVVAITYLSLILGELVPKRLALNGAEVVASRVSGPIALGGEARVYPLETTTPCCGHRTQRWAQICGDLDWAQG